MNFHDLGIIVAKRPHTEHACVLIILTAEHGLYHGLVRVTKSNRAYCQPGIVHKVTWQARLSEHLGSWQIDPFLNTVPALLNDPLALYAVNSACDLISETLNQREPCPNLYIRLSNLLVSIMDACNGMLQAYCLFECELVRVLGVPLNFNACAVTGDTTDLIYVSPRSGRAVSTIGAQGYETKLLKLPLFLCPGQEHIIADKTDMLNALKLSHFFLTQYALDMNHKKMPLSRVRLFDMIVSTDNSKKMALNEQS